MPGTRSAAGRLVEALAGARYTFGCWPTCRSPGWSQAHVRLLADVLKPWLGELATVSPCARAPLACSGSPRRRDVSLLRGQRQAALLRLWLTEACGSASLPCVAPPLRWSPTERAPPAAPRWVPMLCHCGHNPAPHVDACASRTLLCWQCAFVMLITSRFSLWLVCHLAFCR